MSTLSVTSATTSSLDNSVYRSSDTADFNSLTLAISKGNIPAARKALSRFRSNLSESGGLTATLTKRLKALSSSLSSGDPKAMNKALRAVQTAFDYAIRYPQIQLTEAPVRATPINDVVDTTPVSTPDPEKTTNTTKSARTSILDDPISLAPTTGTLLDVTA